MEHTVTILMGTYNGERFIAEQLETILGQTHSNWWLVVSDDGSIDQTRDILETYAPRFPKGRLKVKTGPKGGFCRNFIGLACDPSIVSQFYAFCDQDDLWEADKIEHALSWIKTVPEGVPALYCGRTRSVDEDGKDLGLSASFNQQPCFGNALVQNIGGGNTMVFNEAARQLVVAAGADVVVPSHDWWLYQLVSGSGGAVHYDTEPKVQYRQHNKNLVGANIGVVAGFQRLLRLFKGQLSDWNELNLIALSRASFCLTADNLALVKQLKAVREQPFLARMKTFFGSGLHRQTKIGQLGLMIAVMLGKV